MNRLLGVELDRFASRTLIRLGVLVVLIVSGLAVFAAWQAASPPSATEIAQAQTYYQQNLDDWNLHGDQQIADCRTSEQNAKDDATAAGTDATSIDFGCDQMTAPTLENFLGPAPEFVADSEMLLSGLANLYVLAAVLLAVSFVAAEFSTGAIGNWLTFAPRRTRVYLSKMLAAGIGAIPVTVLGVGVFLGGSWLAYQHFDALGAGDAGPLWAMAGRIVALAVGAAVGGAGLGFLVRHTAAALGILLAWAVVVEGILGNVVTALRPWTLTLNLSAWVNGSAEYYTTVCTTTADGQTCTSFAHTITQTQGGLVLGGVVVAHALLALVVFRRPDVA